MKLKDLLNLNRGDIVSIVGAGGKTTFMYSLAEELRNESKILVTTTTKIYMPEKKYYDFVSIGEGSFDKFNNHNGIYLYGKCVNSENKIIGLNENVIDNKLSYFDYILIEADGSKKKPIKGWKDDEPVVINNTKKTIGIIDIEAIGKEINNDNVHRLEKFINITKMKENDLINIAGLVSLIYHKKGLFKDSKGEKILFINKVEGLGKRELAYKLITCILEKNKGYIDRIISGSLRNKEYSLIKL
ncbi:selenium cofactor biosynthesis protein YqeC [Clostridium thailandense]|uniref:selenium cofactor biosynthesis protein YqeC n=1 Tax=Clostridium thailandense TaxID=2794346 RepID=UPI0039892F52